MLNPKLGYVGERLAGEPKTHFYPCKVCGQEVDKRDLAAVFHHEELGHEPLPSCDAQRVLRVSGMLRFTLEKRQP